MSCLYKYQKLEGDTYGTIVDKSRFIIENAPLLEPWKRIRNTGTWRRHAGTIPPAWLLRSKGGEEGSRTVLQVLRGHVGVSSREDSDGHGVTFWTVQRPSRDFLEPPAPCSVLFLLR